MTENNQINQDEINKDPNRQSPTCPRRKSAVHCVVFEGCIMGHAKRNALLRTREP